jgi:hypothetical protein
MDALARLSEWADDAAQRTRSKKPPPIVPLAPPSDPALARPAPLPSGTGPRERRATQATFVVSFSGAPAASRTKTSVLAMRDSAQARWYDSTFAAIRAIAKERKAK